MLTNHALRDTILAITHAMREERLIIMAKSNNIFVNLRAEMARQNVTITAIAKAIGVSRDTAGKKLAQKAPIQLDEAFIIKDTFFPEKDVGYLFMEAKQSVERHREAG